MTRLIYLDHHAATPPLRTARDAMAAATVDAWANPSSVHAAGQGARKVLDRARERIAQKIGASPADVVLTSGGTEACNLAIQGLCHSRRRVVTSSVEHPAVAEAIRLRRSIDHDIELVTLPVPEGVPPEASTLAPHLDEHTLVAIQHVNHETGTVFPIADYGALCRTHGAALFVDASQGLGKLPVEAAAWGATAIAVSAAKVGGLSGAGALFLARSTSLQPLVVGGGQERGRRAGSPDVAAHAAFGEALTKLNDRLDSMSNIAKFRDKLELGLLRLGAVPNGRGAPRGGPDPRVATVSNVSFLGQRGDVLVAALDIEGVCVSSGAACSSGVGEPSPVVGAMYPSEPARARGALRFSFGPGTLGETDVSTILDRVGRVVERTRARPAPDRSGA